ncbi:MAG: OadG family protein [Paludibacter sp.]|jgi:septation ring formation regulator EzrA|nr:OadG family protein [Paludibacter sp.]
MAILHINFTNGEFFLNSGLAILIVFSALALLVLAFVLSGYISKRAIVKRVEKTTGKTISIENADIPADEIAAIAMALHLCSITHDAHDNESNIITIKQLKRNFSPWNSKNINLSSNKYSR